MKNKSVFTFLLAMLLFAGTSSAQSSHDMEVLKQRAIIKKTVRQGSFIKERPKNCLSMIANVSKKL